MYFWLHRDQSGLWRWTLHGEGHEKIVESDEGYASARECRKAIRAIPVYVPEDAE